MIRNTVVNTINYFYPLGNTPPVSLTQDVPFGKDADILLLGSGDARNILFTCFIDPGRKLDITCCDIEPAIIARNILLYTLILDDTEETQWEQIWNIYYHWKLDANSWDRLEDQMEKLTLLSTTVTQWRESAYGHVIQFRDSRTLTLVRKIWQSNLSRGLSMTQRAQKQANMQKKIEQARENRKDLVGEGVSLSCVRSAAPTGIQASSDFTMVSRRWWAEGVTSSDRSSDLPIIHYNSAFLGSENQSLVLHYGSDPLDGFPLSTAYVPLSSDACLYVEYDSASSADRLVACAQQHFQNWTKSFRKSALTGTLVRFCVADALAVATTLQDVNTAERDKKLTANLFYTPWTCEPLVLDDDGLGTVGRVAPRRFDTIDTSNLVDHLGMLNILPTCARLLNDTAFSTIYTECLVQNSASQKERIANLLGGDIQTIALLLGLSPCEVWTNVTNSPEDESMLDAVNSIVGVKEVRGSTQIRSRLRWKQRHAWSQDSSRSLVKMDSAQLARLMVNLYDHMFDHESMSSVLRDINIRTLANKANPYYNRASFAVVVASVRRTVTTDWPQCLEEMMSLICSGFSQAPLGANFYQELLLHLDMLGTYTNILPAVNLNASKDTETASLFRAWPNVPVHVCVTIRVPLRKLSLFTSKATSSIGTPSLRCTIEGGGVSSRPWSNIFAAVQIAFGQAQQPGDASSALQIVQDDSTWWGASDMFVSFFAPTWTLLQSDGTIPRVKCGLLSTPQSCYVFLGDLGLTLDIHSAKITSESVDISRYMPAMTDIPRFMSEAAPSPSVPGSTVDVVLSPSDASIATLTRRITCTTEAEKAELRDRSTSVSVQFANAMRATVKVGDSPVRQIDFPVPVNHLRHKIRIARKSSYVEIEAPPWDPLTETSECLLFPTALPDSIRHQNLEPIPWTATQVRLDSLPVVDISGKEKMQWLVTHASMMFSTRERQVREDGLADSGAAETKPNMRVEMKDGLFSMLMNYTGLQGQHCQIFGLAKAIGGINVLFFPSCLRLDLINRTVVLDAAVVPLTNAMNADKKVRAFYQNLTSLGVMQIKVSDEELRCWKSVLPALAERCRIWRHSSTCEYAKAGAVPVSEGLNDGHSPICSCGVGKFPVGYLQNLKIGNLQHVLKQYATRIALSPMFPIPYVEDCFTVPPLRQKAQTATTETQVTVGSSVGCSNCGREKKKNACSSGEALLVCAKCKKAKYCSAECQKTDWKRHKGVCSTST